MNLADQLRDVYARLDPTQPIHQPDEYQWYVKPLDGVSTVVTRSLELDPASAHLLVGSIGCGKSTELLAIGRGLAGVSDFFPRYVEVSQFMELDGATGEQLLIAILDELSQKILGDFPEDEKNSGLRKKLQPLLHGEIIYEGWKPPEEDPADYGWYRRVAPRLIRPKQLLPSDVKPLIPHLRTMQCLIKGYYGADLIWLVDGLDRITDSATFDQLVEPFIKALSIVGIGVVIVGPRRSVTGVDRLGVAETFSERHMIHPTDPITEAGDAFLQHILDSRGVSELLPEEAVKALIKASGGAIRILLQLARETIKSAWIRNVEAVGIAQVQVAADKIGRALLLGLTDADLQVLGKVLSSGRFGPRAPEDAALVLTNRILEYRNEMGLPYHVVHPTLVPFIHAVNNA